MQQANPHSKNALQKFKKDQKKFLVSGTKPFFSEITLLSGKNFYFSAQYMQLEQKIAKNQSRFSEDLGKFASFNTSWGKFALAKILERTSLATLT